MTRILGWTCLFLTLALAGCQSRPTTQRPVGANPPAQSSAEQAAPTQLPVERATDTSLWERSRQCASLAEKVIKRKEAEKGEAAPYGSVLYSWENHYSPKFQQCFVYVIYKNMRPDEQMGVPQFLHELIDAVENRTLASGVPGATAGSPFEDYCDIASDHTANCLTVRLYTNERMTK